MFKPDGSFPLYLVTPATLVQSGFRAQLRFANAIQGSEWLVLPD